MLAKYDLKDEDEEDSDQNQEDTENTKPFQVEIKLDEYPVFIFFNMTGNSKSSGVKCFTNEAIKFMQVINDHEKFYNLPVLKKAGIKRKNDDSFF